MSCGWLFCAGGYYRYDQGFTPNSRAANASAARSCIRNIGPRTWTTRGKRVVVIGSGATAVTLIPAMAGTAAHVTMLQRSPTYVIPVPSEDAIANALRGLLGRERWPMRITRRKNVAAAARDLPVVQAISPRRASG